MALATRVIPWGNPTTPGRVLILGPQGQIAEDAALSFASGVLTVGTSVKVGTNPASAGAVRVANAEWVSSRNAGNDADINLIQGYITLNSRHWTKLGAPVVVEDGDTMVGGYDVKPNVVVLRKETGVAAIRSVHFTRVETQRNGSGFFGMMGHQFRMVDDVSVTDSTNNPVLIGAQARVSLRVARTQVGIDDVCGFQVLNKSATDFGTMFDGTDAMYVGTDQVGVAVGSRVKEWHNALTLDTVADRGVLITLGPYQYGIDMVNADVLNGPTWLTVGAMRIPNDSLILGRNQGNSTNINIAKVDTSDRVVIGGGLYVDTTKRVIAGGTSPTTAVTHFEVHGEGVADGAVIISHMRIFDTTAFAADQGGTMTFGGLIDGSGQRSFGAIRGAKANGTSGNAAGYLTLYSRHASNGLLEVLRLTELQDIQFADGVDVVVNATTGTKWGTATTQKQAWWNATPIVQPANTVHTRKALQDAGLIAGGGTTGQGAVLQQVCFDFTVDVATGDGKGFFHVPPSLNGMNLTHAHARVITAGTTGTTDVQIARIRAGTPADTLSTKLTIDSTETGSDTAAAAYVVNATNDDMATNDVLRIDVDAVSTTAPKGLIVTLGFDFP